MGEEDLAAVVREPEDLLVLLVATGFSEAHE